MRWYYRKDCKSVICGPVSTQSLEQLVLTGEVGIHFDLRQEEDGLWFPATTFAESLPFTVAPRNEYIATAANPRTTPPPSTSQPTIIPGPFRSPVSHPNRPVIATYRPRTPSVGSSVTNSGSTSPTAPSSYPPGCQPAVSLQSESFPPLDSPSFVPTDPPQRGLQITAIILLGISLLIIGLAVLWRYGMVDSTSVASNTTETEGSTTDQTGKSPLSVDSAWLPGGESQGDLEVSIRRVVRAREQETDELRIVLGVRNRNSTRKLEFTGWPTTGPTSPQLTDNYENKYKITSITLSDTPDNASVSIYPEKEHSVILVAQPPLETMVSLTLLLPGTPLGYPDETGEFTIPNTFIGVLGSESEETPSPAEPSTPTQEIPADAVPADSESPEASPKKPSDTKSEEASSASLTQEPPASEPATPSEPATSSAESAKSDEEAVPAESPAEISNPLNPFKPISS